MNTIIEKLSETQFSGIGNRNQIIGGIATLEGRIWVAFRNKKVVRMPIIPSDRTTPVPQPIVALGDLERGPTGNHDLILGDVGSIQLLYCHQTICQINGGGNATLCGRSYLMFSDITDDNDSGDDESREYELKTGEHLRIVYGTVRVRVSATGHRIYINSCVKYEKIVVPIV